jgi:hypothetical protein
MGDFIMIKKLSFLVPLLCASVAYSYTLSGYIKDTSSGPVDGVTVTLSSGPSTKTMVTTVLGSWTFIVPNGNYRIQPTKSKWIFSPVWVTTYNVTGNYTKDFFGYSTFTLSGYARTTSSIPIEGVAITLSSGTSNSMYTTAVGTWNFSVQNGNYIVSPTKAGWVFSPVALSTNNVYGNVSRNFVGYSTFTLSGYARTMSSGPLDGVTFTLSGDRSGSMTTTALGTWTFLVPNGNYTVTPTKPFWSFSPASISTNNVYAAFNQTFFGYVTGGKESYKLVTDTTTGQTNTYQVGNIQVGFSTGTPNIVIDSSGVVHWADGTTSTTATQGKDNSFTILYVSTITSNDSSGIIYSTSVVKLTKVIISTGVTNYSGSPIEYRMIGLVFESAYGHEVSTHSCSGITWIGDVKTLSEIGWSGLYGIHTSTGDSQVLLIVNGMDSLRVNGEGTWTVNLSTRFAGANLPYYSVIGNDGINMPYYTVAYSTTTGKYDATYYANLIVGATIYAHTGNFQEVIVSTILGHSPVYMPSGVRCGDNTVITSSAVVGGALPTVYVCASDAPQKLKAVADYVCDGTADDVQLNQASTYLSSIGGGLMQLEGTLFTVSTAVYIDSNITIAGRGFTKIQSILYPGFILNILEVRSGASNVTIKYLSFLPQSFMSNVYAIRLDGLHDNLTIDHCNMNHSGNMLDCGLVFANASSSNVYITNNYIETMGGMNNTPTIVFSGTGSNYLSNFLIEHNTLKQRLGEDGVLGIIDLANARNGIVSKNIFLEGERQGPDLPVWIRSTSYGINIIGNRIPYTSTNGFLISGTSITLTSNSVGYSGLALNVTGIAVKTEGNSWDLNKAAQVDFLEVKNSTRAPQIPTVLIAANDAPVNIKAIANYVCDGVNDDIEFMQAQTDIGTGKINASKGTFTFSSACYVFKDNITFEGEYGATVIKAFGPTLTVGLFATTMTISGLTIKNITFDGKTGAPPGQCPGFYNSASISYVTIEDCYYYGFGYDDIILNSGTMTKAYIHRNKCNAIYGGMNLGSLIDSEVSDNIIWGITSVVFSLSGARNVTVSNNNCSQGSTGMTISNSSSMTVTGNSLSYNTTGLNASTNLGSILVVGNQSVGNGVNAIIATDVSEKANSWNKDYDTTFVIYSSTNSEVGYQGGFISPSTFTIVDVRASVCDVQTDGDVVLNVTEYITGANTLIGSLKIPTGSTYAIALSTYSVAQDRGLKYAVVSNSATVKSAKVNFSIRLEKESGQ